MNTSITAKTSPDSATAHTPLAQDAKLHTGPVARLLAKVSKLSNDYADYQMESCAWRKMSI